MSMTLNLEVAEGVSLKDIRNALVGIECSGFVESEAGFTAVFPNTNVSISGKSDIDNSSILAENCEDEKWLVGLRIYFDVDATLPNPFEDVKKFIQNLSNQTAFEFVLSFQYESLYAKKNSNGLEFSDDF